MSRGLLAACIHLIIVRRSNGLWSLSVHSKLPKEELKHVKVKILIKNLKHSHSFESNVLGPETTRERALQLGETLMLTDEQIKNLYMIERKLFTYTVEITPNLQFIIKLNKCIMEGSNRRMAESIEHILHNEQPSDLAEALERISAGGSDESAAMAVE